MMCPREKNGIFKPLCGGGGGGEGLVYLSGWFGQTKRLANK